MLKRSDCLSLLVVLALVFGNVQPVVAETLDDDYKKAIAEIEAQLREMEEEAAAVSRIVEPSETCPAPGELSPNVQKAINGSSSPAKGLIGAVAKAHQKTKDGLQNTCPECDYSKLLVPKVDDVPYGPYSPIAFRAFLGILEKPKTLKERYEGYLDKKYGGKDGEENARVQRLLEEGIRDSLTPTERKKLKRNAGAKFEKTLGDIEAAIQALEARGTSKADLDKMLLPLFERMDRTSQSLEKVALKVARQVDKACKAAGVTKRDKKAPASKTGISPIELPSADTPQE